MKRIYFTSWVVLLLLIPSHGVSQYWAPRTITEVETQYFSPFFRTNEPFKAALIVRAKSPSTTKSFLFVLRFYEDGQEMGTNKAIESDIQFYVERHMSFADFDYYHSLLNNRKKRRVRLVFRKVESEGYDYLNVVVTRNRKIDQIYPHDDFPDD